MQEGVISVNLVNFVTVGIMALVFVFAVRTVQAKTGWKIPVIG